MRAHDIIYYNPTTGKVSLAFTPGNDYKNKFTKYINKDTVLDIVQNIAKEYTVSDVRWIDELITRLERL